MQFQVNKILFLWTNEWLRKPQLILSERNLQIHAPEIKMKTEDMVNKKVNDSHPQCRRTKGKDQRRGREFYYKEKHVLTDLRK